MAKYRRITEEQRTTANSTDLYSFLTSHGEQLQRHGSGYKLVYTCLLYTSDAADD